MLLRNRYHKLPDRKMYLEMTKAYASTDSMSRNTFECILRNLHLCDNKQLDK